MATVKDVPADAFIAAYAEHLKASDKVRGEERRDGKIRRWMARDAVEQAGVVGTTKKQHLRDVVGVTMLQMGGVEYPGPNRGWMEGMAENRRMATPMRSRP